MNELNRHAQSAYTDATSPASLHAQLTELIEFVLVCEVAAQRQDHIDAWIRYGSQRGSR
jgi:hypothetical protein